MTNAIGFCRCRDREVYQLSRVQGSLIRSLRAKCTAWNSLKLHRKQFGCSLDLSKNMASCCVPILPGPGQCTHRSTVPLSRTGGGLPPKHAEWQEGKQQWERTWCPRAAIEEGDRTHRGGARVLGPPQTALRRAAPAPATSTSQEQRAGPHSPKVLLAPVFSSLGTGDRKEAAWLRKCSCCRTSS